MLSLRGYKLVKLQCDWLNIGANCSQTCRTSGSRRRLGMNRLRNTCLCGVCSMQLIKYLNSRVFYYLNTTPVIMLVILRLRSIWISLNGSLLGLVQPRTQALPLRPLGKDPGERWSRVSQNLGDRKFLLLGWRGAWNICFAEI